MIGKASEKAAKGAYVRRPDACGYAPPLPMTEKGKREGVRDVLTVGNRNRTGYGGKLRACSKRLGFQIFPPK